MRFKLGDRVEIPKRLGGGTGVVQYSWNTPWGEKCSVARFVEGKQRSTIIPSDELYRLPQPQPQRTDTVQAQESLPL